MKKVINILAILSLSLIVISCSSGPSENDVSSDDNSNPEMSQETQKLENGQIDAKKSQNVDEATADDPANAKDDLDATQADNAGNTDSADDKVAAKKDVAATDDDLEKDLQTQSSPEQSPVEPDAAQNPPPPEVAPETAAAPEAKAPEDAAPVESSAGPVAITGLDYKANENGGTVVISTNAPAQYTTEENPDTNQYVVEIQNATLPKKFSRPYNTKDFSGPIGLINAYKKPGTSDVRIVLQLKKPSAISIVQQGNSLVLVPGGDVAASTPEPQAPADASSQTPESADAATEEAPVNTNSMALQSKTLDEFLMGETKFYGKKISIEIINGELRDVIGFIAEESGANVVISDNVTGKVSVKLRQIPWDQALVVIMQTKQLGYVRQANILRIAPLTAIRAETDAARQLLDAQKQLEPLKVKIFPVSYAKAKDLEPQISGFLTTRGTVKADDRTNNLVVKDIAENIVKVKKLLERLDTQTPQVYIEGKVVESQVSQSHDIGINWSTASTSANLGYDISKPGIIKSGVLGLQAALQLLETDQKVRILSAPHVTTLNNQAATIGQSTQFPTYNTTTSATVPPVSTTTVSYITVHLTLNVTPQITADGGVILNTEILREIAGPVDPTPGGVTTGARPINSRNAKSSILVNNGQTAVLGGIYSLDNTQSSGGIPILKDIPILGWLFGADHLTYDKNELLIFLTPRVINKDKAFQMGKDDNPDAESL